MVALHWVRGTDKSWKPFVHNRVKEIKTLTSLQLWSHCTGRTNLADKGITPLKLSQSKLCMEGPEWPMAYELTSDPESEMPTECLLELKASKSKPVNGLLSTVGSPVGMGEVMNCDAFSSYQRLIVVTSLLLWFRRLISRSTHPDASSVDDDHPLKRHQGEYFCDPKAEILWITEAQKKVITDKHFNTWKKQFNLFQDGNKIWMCGGQFQNADIPFTAKHSILLHKDYHLTMLLVKRVHERVSHG